MRARQQFMDQSESWHTAIEESGLIRFRLWTPRRYFAENEANILY